METHRRGSDGRRIFTTQFKQKQIARVVRQELTVAELARELDLSFGRAAVAPPDRERQLSGRGREPRGRAGERAPRRPAAHSRSGAGAGEEDDGGRDSPGRAGRGKKKTALLRRVQAVTGRKMAPICRTLGISRACAYRESVGRPARYARAEDRVVTAQIRTVIRTRASYGARRVRALVNRAFETSYNLKRIQRVMNLNGWTLPRATRRRTGRAHRGLIQRAVSNERWCSDVLEIACWNGEIVQVGFALDCHDREVLAYVAAARDLCAADIQELMRRAVASRFGTDQRPNVPIQWLSDNGSIYTALDTIITAERLHLVPITTPAASPESNGMSEAFVNTMRRDYFAGADLSSAGAVLDQLPAWFADYNAVAPHSALDYQSPHQYRTTMLVAGPKC